MIYGKQKWHITIRFPEMPAHLAEVKTTSYGGSMHVAAYRALRDIRGMDFYRGRHLTTASLTITRDKG